MSPTWHDVKCSPLSKWLASLLCRRAYLWAWRIFTEDKEPLRHFLCPMVHDYYIPSVLQVLIAWFSCLPYAALCLNAVPCFRFLLFFSFASHDMWHIWFLSSELTAQNARFQSSAFKSSSHILMTSCFSKHRSGKHVACCSLFSSWPFCTTWKIQYEEDGSEAQAIRSWSRLKRVTVPCS